MTTQAKGSVLARLFPGVFNSIAGSIPQDQMNQLEEQAATIEARLTPTAVSGQVETPATQGNAQGATPETTPAVAPTVPATPSTPQASTETPASAPAEPNVMEAINGLKAMFENHIKGQQPAAPAAPAPQAPQGSAVVTVVSDVTNGNTQGNAEGDSQWYEDLKRLKAQYNRYGLTDHITV